MVPNQHLNRGARDETSSTTKGAISRLALVVWIQETLHFYFRILGLTFDVSSSGLPRRCAPRKDGDSWLLANRNSFHAPYNKQLVIAREPIKDGERRDPEEKI